MQDGEQNVLDITCVRSTSGACRGYEAILAVSLLPHLMRGDHPRTSCARLVSISARCGSASYSEPPRHSTLGWSCVASSRLVWLAEAMSDALRRRTAWPGSGQRNAACTASATSETWIKHPYSQNGVNSPEGSFAHRDLWLRSESSVHTAGGLRQMVGIPVRAVKVLHISSLSRFDMPYSFDG